MFAQKIRVLPTSFEPQPVFLVTSAKLDPAVDARIVSAFKELRKNGELSAIFAKYGLSAEE